MKFINDFYEYLTKYMSSRNEICYTTEHEKFSEPTLQSTVLLKKLLVTRLFKKFTDFIEPEFFFKS
jgi:hypothetical protein